tara:strand:- start:27844 stop:28065 length:222 start_codon:yes stop_codon:yes gene_type:complete
MSRTDTKEEFYTELDDWWGQLWGNRICASPPNQRIKEKFFYYVWQKASDAEFKINDEDICNLFSGFLNKLGEQ